MGTRCLPSSPAPRTGRGRIGRGGSSCVVWAVGFETALARLLNQRTRVVAPPPPADTCGCASSTSGHVWVRLLDRRLPRDAEGLADLEGRRVEVVDRLEVGHGGAHVAATGDACGEV